MNHQRPRRPRRGRTLAAVTALALGTALAVAVGTAGPVNAAGGLDNPYSDAKPYVNPEWSANARSEPGGGAVANQPTFVWLDRMAAIDGSAGGMSLTQHLDTALSQGANMVQLVIYDLPNRDCSALASNGEIPSGGLATYEHSYIDPIVSILSQSKYANLRIVNLIEPDSLPNLVTNADGQATGTPACQQAKQTGDYINGVGYALAHLGALPNVYNYVDAAHHAWLGWDTNFAPFAQVAHQAATANGATVADVTGFITNTANYSSLQEPFFKITDSVNGTTVRQSHWVDFNQFIDELSYTQALRNQLVSAGFNSGLGMLIDTGRNGWGGPNRPTATSTSTDVNTYVDQSRIDRRIHAGNWCNQSGAGLGERPATAPAAGIDAYVWAKPPGESDGASQPISNDEGKGFDQMCDPNYGGNARNGFNKTGALPNSPLAGHWFSAQFQQLLANAFPPLTGTTPPPTSPPPTSPPPTSPPPQGVGCKATYHVDSDWGAGFTATVTVSNTGGAATKSWRVAWDFAGNQKIVNAWNTTETQSGAHVTADNASFNAQIAAGSSTTFGFQADYSGSNAAPTLSCAAS